VSTWDVRFDLNIDLTDPGLLRCVYEAQALSKVIQGIPLKPAVRERLNRLNIIRAVRGTTGIEGSDLSEAEVEAVLEAPEGTSVLHPSRARDELEVRNARAVMEFVAKVLEADPERKLTEALICELHRITTRDIPYENNVPGQYRSHAVAAGEYVPPRDGGEVRRLMAGFVEWLNSPTVQRWPAVVRAVAAHFYIISIHPFGDGNGRTARSIESYLLYQAQVGQLGFFSLSNFYYRNRPEYISVLDHVRFQSGGDLTPFVRFAARGLLGELELIQDEVLGENKKVVFHDFMIDIISHQGSLHSRTRSRLMVVMEQLIAAGEIPEAVVKTGRHPLAITYQGLSPRAFSRDVDWLVSHELVVRRDRMVAPNYAVMDQFTRPQFP
jgi:Fic family protein